MRLQGSEAHDQLLGQVFGYAAIIRSGQQIDQQTAVRCAEGLTHIANKKSFLRELATNVLLELTGVVITHPLTCSTAELQQHTKLQFPGITFLRRCEIS